MTAVGFYNNEEKSKFQKGLYLDIMNKLRSVVYQVSNRVATITLNRPDALNAIDRYMPGNNIQIHRELRNLLK
jgi:1,4-dihydroxy-2-naphthoyl-CoA synthase